MEGLLISSSPVPRSDMGPFICRLILGAIFVASGIVKIPAIVNFELYIFSLGFLSFDLCSIAARILISTEILLGILLICNIWHRVANLLTAGILMVFSFFLLWRIALGDAASCHCFGDLVEMSPLVSLLKNAALAALLAYAWKSRISFHIPKAVQMVAVLLVYALPFIVTPPDIYYRFYAQDEHAVSEEGLRELLDESASGKKMVLLYSTECQFCQQCSKKVSEIIIRHNLPLDSIVVLFMDFQGVSAESIDAFFDSYGNGLKLDYQTVEAEQFISLSNGEMPLIALMENGRIFREYNYLTLAETELVEFLRPAFEKNLYTNY